MSAFQIAKALVVLLGIFSIPRANAGVPAEYSTATTSSTIDVAGYILRGLANTSTSRGGGGPKVTVSVPQANITWQDKFPRASISHARSCWSAYTEWFASYPGYYASANISLTSTPYTELATFVHPGSSTAWPTGNISTYKLCDGTPRATYVPSTTHFDSSLITAMETYSTSYPTPIPEQACTLDQADCAVMYFGTNLNNLSDANADNSWAQGRLLAACGYPLDTEAPCLVQGGPVEVLYFPVSTTGGDLGGCTPGTTVTPAEEPAPITTLGSTFHPGTVYLSFETLYAAYRSLSGPGGAAVQIDRGYSNAIFEFQSDEISTNCYASVFSTEGLVNPGYGPGTQLNFADLNDPPPATAYACQNQCESVSYELGPGGVNVTTHTIQPNPCKTIFDNFNPLIAVPTRLRERHAEWASCSFWDHRQANIVFDPPIALTEAASAAEPTLPGTYVMTSSAMPASTATNPASRTATAIADKTPSATSNVSPYNPGAQESGSAGSWNMQSTAIAFTRIYSTDGTNQVASRTSAGQVLAAGDVTITAVSISGATDAVEVHGSTVSVGGPAVTVGGEILSMESGGLIAVPGSASIASRSITFTPIPTQEPVPIGASDQQILAAGDVTITAVSISGLTNAVEVHGSTVSVGGPAMTLDGETLSLDSGGLVAVYGSAATSSQSPASTPVAFTPVVGTNGKTRGTARASSGQVFAAGALTITAVPISGAAGAVEVERSTLSVGGPAATIDGEIVSMGTDGLVEIHTGTKTSSRSTSRSSSQPKSSIASAASTTSGSIGHSAGSLLAGYIGLFAVLASIHIA